MAAQPTRSDLQLFRIRTPDDERVPLVLALSNAIFSADASTKHGSLPYWQTHLSHPSSFVLYLARPDTPNEPVAFVFAIPRVTEPPLRNGRGESTHVWLAGVLHEWRNGGCLARMVRELDGIAQLTVCTFPTRFPDMWRWLTHRGWIQERELTDGKVLLSRCCEQSES